MSSSTLTATVRPATGADHPAIGAVLAAAFADDPVFAWMTSDAARRRTVLPAFFRAYAAAFEPLGASRIVDDVRDRVAGAALWAPPAIQAVPDEDAEGFMTRMAEVLGPDTGRCIIAFELLERHLPATPCHYLSFLGVDPARHRAGLGSALLASALRRCDVAGEPAYLEATSPDNRRLYARHGFAVAGEIRLPDGPSLWPMWREARP